MISKRNSRATARVVASALFVPVAAGTKCKLKVLSKAEYITTQNKLNWPFCEVDYYENQQIALLSRLAESLVPL